jgi:hypothetical protein
MSGRMSNWWGVRLELEGSEESLRNLQIMLK